MAKRAARWAISLHPSPRNSVAKRMEVCDIKPSEIFPLYIVWHAGAGLLLPDVSQIFVLLSSLAKEQIICPKRRKAKSVLVGGEERRERKESEN